MNSIEDQARKVLPSSASVILSITDFRTRFHIFVFAVSAGPAFWGSR